MAIIQRMTKSAYSQQLQRLSARLFWDVDPAAVDPDEHRRYVIPRIMDRGTREDVKAAWSFYGEETIREVLLNAASLHKKTIAFFACQFDLPRESFRAFRSQTGRWSQ